MNKKRVFTRSCDSSNTNYKKGLPMSKREAEKTLNDCGVYLEDFISSSTYSGCIVAIEKHLEKELSAIWNFLPEESLPKKDKAVLIFRPNHIPEVIGAFYEGNVEHGEFHNGGDDVHRIVYSDIKAWTDVLNPPKAKL